MLGAVALGIADDGEGAGHEQAAQVAVTLFADTAELLSTAARVLLARRELGILRYQRFVSGDGKTVHVYERYADSAAALTHLGIFAKKFAELFHDMVERKCFVVFGYPTTELQAALDAFGAIYFEPLGDFAYWA